MSFPSFVFYLFEFHFSSGKSTKDLSLLILKKKKKKLFVSFTFSYCPFSLYFIYFLSDLFCFLPSANFGLSFSFFSTFIWCIVRLFIWVLYFSLMFCGLAYDLSWTIFHMCLKRMCILLLLDGMFTKCLLGSYGLMCNLSPIFPSLKGLSVAKSEVLKFPTIIALLSISLFSSGSICFIYLSVPNDNVFWC